MRASFAGLDIGRKALAVAQAALDVTGHNIANANTPGYSRQVVNMQTTTPFQMGNQSTYKPYVYVGTGVTITEINRVREEFIDAQFRKESKTQGEWEAKQDALEKVEVVLNEPSLSGIKTVLQEFWNSWSDLSKNAESSSLRAVVREKGQAVATTFQHIQQQLVDQRSDLDQSVRIKVDEVNALAKQVGDLNMQITRAGAGGGGANDLMDRRDLLVDKLSKLVNMQVVATPDNYTLMVGGVALVAGTTVNTLATQRNAEGYQDITWSFGGEEALMTSGTIKGLLDSRDQIAKNYLAQINKMAANLIHEVNKLHSAGQGLDGNPGIDFFATNDDVVRQGIDPITIDGVDYPGNAAALMTVNPDILNTDDIGLQKIAAAQAGTAAPGDGSNALAINSLAKATMTGLGTTANDYLQSMVASLGVDSQHAQLMAENQQTLVDQLSNRRDSVTGVNLDEEMTKMVQYQQSYNAAAKLISVMDEMLDTLINRVGGS